MLIFIRQQMQNMRIFSAEVPFSSNKQTCNKHTNKYNWREMPQVSFLSRQNYMYATRLLLKQKYAYVCRDKYLWQKFKTHFFFFEASIHTPQTLIFEGRSFHNSGFSSEGSIYFCVRTTPALVRRMVSIEVLILCIARVMIIIFIVRLATNVSVPFASGWTHLWLLRFNLCANNNNNKQAKAKQQHQHHNQQQQQQQQQEPRCREIAFNPFIATACTIYWLKISHINASKQYIWWSYHKSIFNNVHFDRSPFTSKFIRKGEKPA